MQRLARFCVLLAAVGLLAVLGSRSQSGPPATEAKSPAVELSRFEATGDLKLFKIPAIEPDDADGDFSGVTYNPTTKTLLVVDNAPNAGNKADAPDQGDLYEFDLDGKFRRHINLDRFADPEAIACMGDDPDVKGNVRFVIAEERIGELCIVSIDGTTESLTIEKSKLPKGSVIRLDPNPVDDGDKDENDGIESVAYDASAKVFYVAKERGGKRGVYRVQMDGKTVGVPISRLFKGVEGKHDPVTDLADLHYGNGALFILSHESKLVLKVALSEVDSKWEGKVVEQFPPVGKTLPHKQAEGLTLSDDGRQMWIIGEPRESMRYQVKDQIEAR